MKLKMIALMASFAVAAGFGRGSASTSLSQSNPRICSAKNLCRNGNGVVLSLTEMTEGPKQSEDRLIACASGTPCVPPSPFGRAIERLQKEADAPLCPPQTPCVPPSPFGRAIERFQKEAGGPACPPQTPCVPPSPFGRVIERFQKEADVPLCPTGTPCVPPSPFGRSAEVQKRSEVVLLVSPAGIAESRG
jgi:hypothetical protein